WAGAVAATAGTATPSAAISAATATAMRRPGTCCGNAPPENDAGRLHGTAPVRRPAGPRPVSEERVAAAADARAVARPRRRVAGAAEDPLDQPRDREQRES